MAFAFALPDPDSSYLVETQGEDGIIETSATPELAGAIDAVIAAQTEALSAVMGGVADTIQRQLVFQQQALGEQQRAIQQTVTQQLAGQRAALDVAMHAVADGVTQTLARQREDVGTAAVAAAMQPRQPAPPPYTAPSAPPAVRPLPPAPWRGKTGGGGPFSSPATTVTSPQAPTPRTSGMTTQVVMPPPQGQTDFSAYLTPTTPATEIAGQSGATVPPEPQAAAWSGTILSPLPPQPYTPPADHQVEPEGGAQGAGGGPAQGGAAQGACPPPTIQVMPCASPPVQVTVNVDGMTQTVTVIEPDEKRKRGVVVAAEEDVAAAAARGAAAAAKDVCPWQIGDKLPMIGGPEWCRLQDQIARSLAGAGNAMISLVWQTWDVVAGGSGKGQWPTAVPEIIAEVNPFTAIGKAILSAVPAVGKTVRQLADCWRQIAAMAPQCHPATLVGVVVIRAVMRCLHNLRMGTDAGVWLTIDLSIDLPQLERAAGYIVESLCPSKIPGAQEAWSAYSAGLIDEPTWRCWTLSEGLDPELWMPVREAHGQVLRPEQVILWSRLQGAGRNDADDGLKHRGWTRGTDRQVMLNLYDRPADGAQYLAWAATGALDEGLTKILRRDDAFSQWWMGEPGDHARAYGMTEEVARFQWRAGRPAPGPQELQQYVWRLRDDTPERGPAFAADTARAIMAAGGMAPAAVDWAMQTMYRPMAVQDAVMLAKGGRLDFGAIRVAYRDSGYAMEDATALALAAWQDGNRFWAAANRLWTLEDAGALLRAGMPAPASLVFAMANQGWEQADVRLSAQHAGAVGRAEMVLKTRHQASDAAAKAAMLAYRTGGLDVATTLRALVAAGYEPASANALMSAADISETARRVAQSIRMLRRGVVSGQLSLAQGQVLLARIGVRPERVRSLTSAWQIDRASTRPMSHVADIRKWVAHGLLSPKAARQRLVNLGWIDPDLTLQMQEMGQQLARAQATARRKGANAQAAAAKAAERVKQQALRALERQRPVGALAQWYLDGLLGPSEVRERMRQYGYGDGTIDLYLHSWDHKARVRAAATGGAAKGTTLTPQRQVPIGRIRAWYLDDIVARDWADRRLASYGYDDETRGGYLLEWDRQRAERSGKKKAPGTL